MKLRHDVLEIQYFKKNAHPKFRTGTGYVVNGIISDEMITDVHVSNVFLIDRIVCDADCGLIVF